MANQSDALAARLHLEKAIEFDHRGQLRDALSEYKISCGLLIKVISRSKNHFQREELRKQALNVVSRAELLRDLINEEELEEEGALINALNQVSAPNHTPNLVPTNDEHSSASNVKFPEAREVVEKTIVQSQNSDEKYDWSDVAGLSYAKRILEEALLLPSKFPQLFTGRRKPWKSILLYGPPGTGKTYLMKCLASIVDCTLFSISSCDLLSRSVGESEKIVRELFACAQERQPSIIFMDELDGIATRNQLSEHEASRRLFTELLICLSNLDSHKDSVLFVGATNMPQNLGSALLRRFAKRLYIGLPSFEARFQILNSAMQSNQDRFEQSIIEDIAKRTEGYSGSDLVALAKDILMGPIRVAMAATHWKFDRNPILSLFTKPSSTKIVPCRPTDWGAQRVSIIDLPPDQVALPPISEDMIVESMNRSKPSVEPRMIKQYDMWTKQFGSEDSSDDYLLSDDEYAGINFTKIMRKSFAKKKDECTSGAAGSSRPIDNRPSSSDSFQSQRSCSNPNSIDGQTKRNYSGEITTTAITNAQSPPILDAQCKLQQQSNAPQIDEMEHRDSRSFVSSIWKWTFSKIHGDNGSG